MIPSRGAGKLRRSPGEDDENARFRSDRRRWRGAHAERLAAAMGYGEIRLYTNARFVENVAFYRRLGYAITREAPYLGGRVAHMSKRLGAA